MKYIDQIRFDKLKFEWTINLIATGIVYGDKTVGDIIEENDKVHDERNAMRTLIDKGYDIVFKKMEEDEEFGPPPSEHNQYDAFGNPKPTPAQRILKARMKQMEKIGKKLLAQERYEQLQEIHYIWNKLNNELKRLS